MLLTLVALTLVADSRTSEAQGAIEMGLDMETTGNTANTLGPIQTCYRVVWSGTPFDGVADRTIDVYVSGDTQAPVSYDAWVTYDSSKVHVVSPTDPLIKMPGAQNFGDSPPDSDGTFNGGASYLSPPYNGIPGNGTLVRIGLDIGASGTVAFGLAKGGYRSAAGLHTVTTVSGRLAINGTCSVGGIAELPDVASGTGSPGRYSMVLVVVGVAGTIALGAGAVYANKRWLRQGRLALARGVNTTAKSMRQGRRRSR